ncbi:MAG: hypothetical protein ACREKI_03765 [Gemmatimonadota bacterium]
MTGSIRGGARALALAVALTACRGSSELAPPGPEERAAILGAVRAHLPEGTRAELVLTDPAAGQPRTLEVVKVGEVRVVRSRLYRVEAQGVDAEGGSHPIRFYVVQTGPVFVVDTAVLAPRGSAAFAP